jgi:hypothetical protein
MSNQKPFVINKKKYIFMIIPIPFLFTQNIKSQKNIEMFDFQLQLKISRSLIINVENVLFLIKYCELRFGI